MITYGRTLLNGDREVFRDGKPAGIFKAPTTSEARQGLSPVIIFSAYGDRTMPYRNKLRHDIALRTLRAGGIPHDNVAGRYQGCTERRIIVRIDKPEHRWAVHTLATHFQQRTILYVTPERKALLQHANGRHIRDLGALKVVKIDEAERARSYTFANGCYYVTER